MQLMGQWLIISQRAKRTNNICIVDGILFADNYTLNIRDIELANNIYATITPCGFRYIVLFRMHLSMDNLCRFRWMADINE